MSQKSRTESSLTVASSIVHRIDHRGSRIFLSATTSAFTPPSLTGCPARLPDWRPCVSSWDHNALCTLQPGRFSQSADLTVSYSHWNSPVKSHCFMTKAPDVAQPPLFTSIPASSRTARPLALWNSEAMLLPACTASPAYSIPLSLCPRACYGLNCGPWKRCDEAPTPGSSECDLVWTQGLYRGETESDVIQSCPTLCNPIDCSPPGSSVHGILQARVLEWGAIAFSRPGSPKSYPGLSIIYLLLVLAVQIHFLVLIGQLQCIPQSSPAFALLRAETIFSTSICKTEQVLIYNGWSLKMSVELNESVLIARNSSWDIACIIELPDIWKMEMYNICYLGLFKISDPSKETSFNILKK